MAYEPADAPVENNTCPSPEDMIANFLKQTKLRKPSMFPSDPREAARYWMEHQNSPDNFTEPVTPPVKKGGEWGTPYHNRLIFTLKKFMRMKSVHQIYVIEYIEKGIAWKGDEIHFYQTVVEESAKMSENMEEYIAEGCKKMRRVLMGMGV